MTDPLIPGPSLYDMEFTTKISNRMQVPDRISLARGNVLRGAVASSAVSEMGDDTPVGSDTESNFRLWGSHSDVAIQDGDAAISSLSRRSYLPAGRTSAFTALHQPPQLDGPLFPDKSSPMASMQIPTRVSARNLDYTHDMYSSQQVPPKSAPGYTPDLLTDGAMPPPIKSDRQYIQGDDPSNATLEDRIRILERRICRLEEESKARSQRELYEYAGVGVLALLVLIRWFVGGSRRA